MPLINLADPFNVLIALILFLLCLFLSRSNKKNTAMCIFLLVFLTILVGHTIEMSLAVTSSLITLLAKCIFIDEVFVFVSFLSFIWVDRIQIEEDKKRKSGKKKSKKGDKIIEDDLDILWKKV